MDWLLEFEGLIVPVTLILLYLLQRVFTRDEGEQAPGRGLGDAPSAAEEKARQIREEIGRKIVARQQGREAPRESREASRRKIVARQQGRAAPRELEPPAFFEEDQPAPGRAFEPFPRRAEPPPLVEEPFPAAPPIFPHYEVRPPTPPPPPEPE